MKCLEKDPRRRYSSAFALTQDLRRFLAGEPTQAEQWLARYHQAWQGDARRIFLEAAI